MNLCHRGSGGDGLMKGEKLMAIHKPNADSTPAEKALYTALVARRMTKWLVSHPSKNGVKWQLVEFNGRAGQESGGIVDLIAIRKNHKPLEKDWNRGDLFEIVLLQVKGGKARYPTGPDVARLLAVKDYHRAERVLLAEWKPAEKLCLYELTDPNHVEPSEIREKKVAASDVFGKVPKLTIKQIHAAALAKMKK